MTFIGRLFGKTEPPLTLDHPVFGRLQFLNRDGWQNRAFAFWGFEPVDVVITAGREGPSMLQADQFLRLRDSHAQMWPRCVAALEAVRASLRVAPARFRVTGVSVPSLGPERAGNLWTIWVDLEGDDHFMYGVQSQDGWRTLAAFADD